ncbi:MAG: acyl--CoA ligase, partial [Blastocatellia bacterium]|nr:acyl--CoA ligase [Blastocatellia bacterium]
CLPLSFTFGLGHVHAQLLLGGQAHLFASMRDNPSILHALATDGITGFLASPGMLKVMVQQHREEFSLKAKGLSYLVINCTPMPVELTEKLLNILPDTRIYMYYGMTEASRSAYNFYNQNLDKLACTGRATKGISLKIDNPNSEGEGEICIKGPNLMLGYWGEEESSCIDREGWLHTGDQGVMDEDGFITVKGRVKEQISVDGMKCQPLEIESVISRYEGVEDAAVVAIPSEYTYQTVGAAVVTKPKMVSSEEEKQLFVERVKEHCLKSLEMFKIPTKFVFVDSIPRTELGKIKRLEIQQMLMQQ